MGSYAVFGSQLPRQRQRDDFLPVEALDLRILARVCGRR